MASPSRWAITETVEQGEIAPVHIGERDMVVTRARNIKNEVWVRHVHYLPGDPPDYHEVNGSRWCRPRTKTLTRESPNKLATKRDHPQNGM